MKKTMIGLFLLMGLVGWFCQTPALSVSPIEYTVDASTYPMADGAGDYQVAQIAGNAAIEQIWFSNSSTSTAQTVDVYELCGSSLTVALKWRGYIPLGANAGQNPLHLEYPLWNTPMLLTDACFRKSATGSDVQVNVHYR